MSLGRVFVFPALGLLFPLGAWSQIAPAAQNSQPPTLQLWTPPHSNPQASPAPQTSQPPSYSNYSIMLVSPPGGSSVVLMHNPNNGLEFVDVRNTKQALLAGYVPVRAIELGELISALKEQNAQLTDENTRLRIEVAKQVPSTPSIPSQTEAEAQQRAQIDAENAARRQQMIQTWMMLQNMNRSQPYRLPQPYRPLPSVNPNGNRLQTNCTTQSVGSTSYTDCN